MILETTERKLEYLKPFSLPQIKKKMVLEVKSGLETDSKNNSENKGILILNLMDFFVFF